MNQFQKNVITSFQKVKEDIELLQQTIVVLNRKVERLEAEKSQLQAQRKVELQRIAQY